MKQQNTQNSLNNLELATAYILINVEKGSEKQVINSAKSFGNVKEAYICYGLYDVILKVKLNSTEKLKDLLIHKYRKIKSVKTIIILFIESKKESVSLEPLISCNEYLSYSKEKVLKTLCFPK